ncbi:MAG: DUF362 domain-containing protein [Anaerolineae bacterium]
MAIRFSRRAFLRLLGASSLGVAIGAGVRVTANIYGSVPLRTRLGWLARSLEMRVLASPALVALGECPHYDNSVLDCLRQVWQQAAMPDVRDRKVLVKPNLIDAIESNPVTTAPQVVGALVDLLIELGAREVIVGDGPGNRREAWPVAQACGLAPELLARGIPLVDLNYDDPRPVPAPPQWFGETRQLWLPRSVREADLIVSVPKLKTHHWAGISLSLKNLFGLLPGARYGWPKNFLHFNGIARSIMGLYETARILAPVVAVVDGITGMEGDGPLFGKAVAHGLLAAGRDPVAVDTVCAGLMGFTLEQASYLEVAAWTGAGQAARINTVGVSRERLRRQYELPPGM